MSTAAGAAVDLWRIATETRTYAADDLTGAGAAVSPGRWNDAGIPVVYAAPTISLAVLETAAHVVSGGLPLNRYLVRIQVPQRVWEARQVVDVSSLPPQWAAIPSGRASAIIGTDWLRRNAAAILLVPSVIVPEEFAALINPAHPEASRLQATVVRAFEYDKLLGRRA